MENNDEEDIKDWNQSSIIENHQLPVSINLESIQKELMNLHSLVIKQGETINQLNERNIKQDEIIVAQSKIIEKLANKLESFSYLEYNQNHLIQNRKF